MFEDPFSLRGRVALITGGSRGIGKMIAKGFIAYGARVYISSRKADVCEQTARELSAGGGFCEALPIDASTNEAIAALTKAFAARETKLDTWFMQFVPKPELLRKRINLCVLRARCLRALLDQRVLEGCERVRQLRARATG